MEKIDPIPTISILHTNDFHNRLTAEQATRLKSLRLAQEGRGVLLDAGDAVGSGNITYKRRGEPILTTMSEIGYDAMTIGNRDFHFSETGFRAKTMLARFPVLCANVQAKVRLGATEDVPVLDHIFMERNGWRIVVLGLTVPMITERMMARHISPYVFEDPIATARRLVPLLREKYSPDLFVALTHIGLPRDRQLAVALPDIDLILGGHSHDILPEGERVGAVLIAQTGCWAHHLGRVVVSRSSGNARPLIVASVEAL